MSAPVPPETAIMLIAEHALVRAGLRAVLESTAGFRIVADAPTLIRASAMLLERVPDLLVLTRAPRDDAEERALGRLRARYERVCVMLLDEDADGHADLTCVPTSANVSDFCDAAGLALNGACAGCALRTQCVSPKMVTALSPRETQVAVSVAAGLSTKQVAGALGISVRTVNTYRESLARKLGASSAAVLTRFVIEHGLDKAR